MLMQPANKLYLMNLLIIKMLLYIFTPKIQHLDVPLRVKNSEIIIKKFKKLNTEILGVSRESIKSHEKFKSKEKFPFELLSDPDEKVCKAFGVMKLKSMYGREYMGIDRSTFLINTKGEIEKEWRAVKVKGHVQEVLEATKELVS